MQLDSGGEGILKVAEGVAFRRKHLERSMTDDWTDGRTDARGSGVIG